MRKLLFSTILLLCAGIVYGQGAKVNTAYANFTNATAELSKNNLEDAVANLKEAAEAIDIAITNEKTMAKAKTWRYRGNIYAMIAGIETMNADYPNAINIATESYAKSNELDTKKSYEKEVNIALMGLHDTEFNSGNIAFGEEKFEEAIHHYDNSKDIFEALNLVDSVAYFNAGLAADNGKLTEAALENYLAAARMDYQGPYCYNRSVVLLKDQEKYDEALEISKEGRAKYPEDKELITAQLNVYLAADMFEEAEKEMEDAAADKPEDPSMWFALAVVKDNLDKPEEAEKAYLSSLEADPDYFNSNMNLAILYFSKASKMIEVANEIPAKEIDRYNNAIGEAKEVLKNAVPYFEKAYEIKPDRNILIDLKEAYGQLGDTENYKRVKDLLDSE